MKSEKIEVINYLDRHGVTKNKKMEKFSTTKLQEVFPNIDESSLATWEKEWRTGRQRMLDIKF